MAITANHAHLMPPNSWLPGDADLLLGHLDACGIERAVVFAPFGCQMDGDMLAANRWALDQCDAHDRLIPFGCIAPIAHDATEVLAMLHDRGVRGCKVHPSIDVYDLTDPRAMKFYEAAARLGFVLDFHTGAHGTQLALCDPVKFDTIAWEFPELTLVFEHMGGRTYFEIFLAMVANHHGDNSARSFAGLTSIYDAGTHPLWYLGPDGLRDMVRILGAKRLIFGLDFPWNSIEHGRRDIAMIRELGLPVDDEAAILGGNLLALVEG